MRISCASIEPGTAANSVPSSSVAPALPDVPPPRRAPQIGAVAWWPTPSSDALSPASPSRPGFPRAQRHRIIGRCDERLPQVRGRSLGAIQPPEFSSPARHASPGVAFAGSASNGIARPHRPAVPCCGVGNQLQCRLVAAGTLGDAAGTPVRPEDRVSSCMYANRAARTRCNSSGARCTTVARDLLRELAVARRSSIPSIAAARGCASSTRGSNAGARPRRGRRGQRRLASDQVGLELVPDQRAMLRDARLHRVVFAFRKTTGQPGRNGRLGIVRRASSINADPSPRAQA